MTGARLKETQRVAVISDVHGNAFALEAVLREVGAAAPDLTVNLGDQVEGSADPARAAALQASLGAAEVRGNNEERFWPGGRRTPLSVEYGAWLSGQLDPVTAARLAALPLSARLLGGRLFACHGTPTDAWTSLLWVWDPAQGLYLARAPHELRALVAPLAAEVVVCGHTHRPGATRVGDTLVVNAGAVSDQVDGDPRARWTLLERRGGRWTVDFRAVPYDVEEAVAWASRHSPFGAFQAGLLRGGVMDGRGS
ncbi:metallophosphoesterase family protein [Deinococcus hohokamensis]|uniref:Metallophosphoesterase family protein n=1 Tax=Deinococcus hohokamensis TaxID=309883 RepID=A0ABV9I6S8_9DEIO